MSEEPKVLMSAYACEPGKGSEPEVGWRVATEMARCCRVTVVTRANNRPAIDAGLAAIDGRRPEFIYYDLPGWCRWLKKRGLGVAWYYVMWQAGVRRLLRGDLGRHDLVHHVTFNGAQLPGFWRKERVPVVLGPLGGGMTCPAAYLPLFGSRQRGEVWRGRIVANLHRLPWWRAILRDAAVVIAANRETAALIQPHRQEEVPVMLETAVPGESIVPDVPARGGSGRFEMLWLGNLMARKAPSLALRALALALEQRPDLHLTLAGAGPEEESLREWVVRLGLAERVTFAGRVPKAEVNDLMDRADVFLFTSVRDTSGNVVLEAMSRGLPVIAIHHQGVREICDSTSALLVEPGTIEETVAGIAKAMIALSGDPELRRSLAAGALRRVAAQLTWARFRERMLDFYRLALRDRPTFQP